MFRFDERDSTAETPVVGDGRREMSIELQMHNRGVLQMALMGCLAPFHIDMSYLILFYIIPLH